MTAASRQSAKPQVPTGWLGWVLGLVAAGVLALVLTEHGSRSHLIIGLSVAGGILLLAYFLETQLRHRVLRQVTAADRALARERDEAVAQKSKDDAILSSIADGVLGLDESGRVMLFNRAATDLSGLKAGDILGRHYSEAIRFVHEKSGRPHTGFIEHTLAGEQDEAANVALIAADGKEVPVAVSAAPIIGRSGKQHGAIITFRNVTHERQLEQAKDEFVSLASHQLRAPLTAMRLFVEMLLDNQVGKLNAKQRDYLTKVELSTWRMIDLVNDFLNTSRIELDRLKVDPQEIHLEELVASIVETIRPLAEQKNLALVFDKPKLPSVYAEPNLYSQIVNNLLTNAIRYTPAGGTVVVTLARHKDGYQLDVADSGIGIPKSAQAELFKRFYRADNAKRLESEGSGLGLYLIKRILDLSGGRVWYETAEGHGTTFHVIIPLSGMVAKTAVNGAE